MADAQSPGTCRPGPARGHRTRAAGGGRAGRCAGRLGGRVVLIVYPERPARQENIRFPPLGGGRGAAPAAAGRADADPHGPAARGGGQEGPLGTPWPVTSWTRPRQNPEPVPHVQAGPESQAAPGSERPHVGLGGRGHRAPVLGSPSRGPQGAMSASSCMETGRTPRGPFSSASHGPEGRRVQR